MEKREWRDDCIRLCERYCALENDMVDTIRALFATLWTDDEGQDLAEYALLLILVAVLIVTAVTAFRTQISTAFSRATAVLATTS